MPRENRIAACTCPICQSKRAEIRLSAKNLAYIMCDACNFQGFARSDRSDRLMRDLAIDDKAGEAEPAATAPKVKQAPGPAPAPAAATPAPVLAPQKAPLPAPKAFTWGAFP